MTKLEVIFRNKDGKSSSGNLVVFFDCSSIEEGRLYSLETECRKDRKGDLTVSVYSLKPVPQK